MLERMQNVCTYHLHEIQQTISQAPLKTQNPLILKMTDIGRIKEKNYSMSKIYFDTQGLCRTTIKVLLDFNLCLMCKVG